MIYLIILLFLIVVILIYLVYITNKKITLYEKFITDRRYKYKQLLFKIKDIDNKEIFEKDDDVGVTFSEIKSEIEEFDKFLE